ncbi:MAG: permease [Clostridiales bacterium]|nr:permease [Clostridiales bacterium]MCF8023710.1 permease [Clostridiales bacterium]
MTVLYILQSGFSELLEYLSAHVLTCLVPAFFIAGGMAAIVATGSVIKYFGPRAPKHLSYGVASVSGAILAVCSCTVLPLFAGIHKKGAGLGPAVTFLFSGPAVNILAITLTARKMGWELGLARAAGAVIFSIVIGLLMAFIFRRDEEKNLEQSEGGEEMFAGEKGKPVGHLLAFFGALAAILLFGTASIPFWSKIAIVFSLLSFLAVVLIQWFDGEEIKDWLVETWKFVKLIFPILLIGVFAAGILKAVIPHQWIAQWVGGNSLTSNLTASVIGALMYFSTLTEVPIVKAFLDMGMGQGPALTLLLAGPSLSLPNMLVVRNVMGTKRTLVYILLVIVLATTTGMLFGSIVS